MSDEGGRREGPADGAGDLGYASFNQLRQAHLLLRKLQVDVGNTQGAPISAAKIQDFISRGCATGANLRDVAERQMAQTILDFWSVELADCGAVPSHSKPSQLKPFQEATSPEDKCGLNSESDAALSVGENDPRAAIRFGAAARLWQDSGKKTDYLLARDAIGHAAKLQHYDTDIAELVSASKVARTKARRRFFAAAAIVSLVFVSNVILLVLYLMGMPKLTQWETSNIRHPSATTSDQVMRMFRLQYYQQVTPPSDSRFDLANVTFKGADLRSIRLNGPNLAKARINDVAFDNAQLPHVAFHWSTITNGSFYRANLPFAQFRSAEFDVASFAKAQLTRAAFDSARLCSVDFSEADLRGATFFRAELDDDFAKNFRNTAWWLAEGWTTEQQLELAKQPHSDVRKTEAFLRDIEERKSTIRKEKIGSFERALALNDYAWTLATYGVEPFSEPGPPKISKNCMQTSRIPDSALEAAEQAVCILKSMYEQELNVPEPKEGQLALEVRRVLAAFKDTLGYTLMQAGRLPEAREELEYAARYVGIGEVRFRLAVVKFALSGDDPRQKRRSLEDLSEVIKRFKYYPTHELVQLKPYIRGEFERLLNKAMQVAWSEPYENVEPCPPPPTTTKDPWE